jgi:hypothetical protein
MTRRLLAAVTMTAFISGGLAVFASAASADVVCLYGDNQRRPGSYQGLCLEWPPVELRN